jgi:hypothetical protein
LFSVLSHLPLYLYFPYSPSKDTLEWFFGVEEILEEMDLDLGRASLGTGLLGVSSFVSWRGGEGESGGEGEKEGGGEVLFVARSNEEDAERGGECSGVVLAEKSSVVGLVGGGALGVFSCVFSFVFFMFSFMFSFIFSFAFSDGLDC